MAYIGTHRFPNCIHCAAEHRSCRPAQQPSSKQAANYQIISKTQNPGHFNSYMTDAITLLESDIWPWLIAYDLEACTALRALSAVAALALRLRPAQGPLL
eukprot:scaffold430404_cov48-Prasinocladus_malaysianus.AAC.1